MLFSEVMIRILKIYLMAFGNVFEMDENISGFLRLGYIYRTSVSFNQFVFAEKMK